MFFSLIKSKIIQNILDYFINRFGITINDRWSSFVWIRKLNGKNAEDLAMETINTLKQTKELIHTITGDNGKEFACHETISLNI